MDSPAFSVFLTKEKTKIIIFAYEKKSAKIKKKLSLKKLFLLYPLWVIIRKIKNFFIATFFDSIFDSIVITPAEYSRGYSIDEEGINEIKDFNKNGKSIPSACFISVLEEKEI